MCECLVTGCLDIGYLQSFFLTVILGFSGGSNLVWGKGGKNSFFKKLAAATSLVSDKIVQRNASY